MQKIDYLSSKVNEIMYEISHIRNNYMSELEKAKEQYSRELANIVTNYSTDLQTIKNNFNIDLEQIKTGYNTELEQIKGTYTGDLNQLKSTYTKRLEEILSSYSNELSTMQDNYLSEMDLAKTNYENEISSLKSSYQVEMDRIKNNYSSELNSIKQTYSTELNSIKSTYSTELSEIKATYTNDLQELKSGYTTQLDEMLESSSTNLQEVLDTYAVDLNEIKNTCSADLEEIKGNYSTQLGNLATEYETLISDYTAALQVLIKNNNDELDSLRISYENDIKKIKNDYEEEFHLVISSYDSSIQMMQQTCEDLANQVHSHDERLLEVENKIENQNKTSTTVRKNCFLNPNFEINQNGKVTYSVVNGTEVETVNDWFITGTGSFGVNKVLSLNSGAVFKQSLNINLASNIVGKTAIATFYVTACSSNYFSLVARVWSSSSNYIDYTEPISTGFVNLIFNASSPISKIEIFIENTGSTGSLTLEKAQLEAGSTFLGFLPEFKNFDLLRSAKGEISFTEVIYDKNDANLNYSYPNGLNANYISDFDFNKYKGLIFYAMVPYEAQKFYVDLTMLNSVDSYYYGSQTSINYTSGSNIFATRVAVLENKKDFYLAFYLNGGKVNNNANYHCYRIEGVL